MNFFNLIFSLSFFIMISSCSNQKEQVETEEKLEVVEEIKEQSIEMPVLQSLPLETVNRLFKQTNSLEGTFYNSGKSIALWDENIQNVMALMIDPPPTSLKTKNLVGHINLLKKDELSADVIAYIEIYMAGADSYVIFKIDDQKYYQTLSKDGLDFFNKMAAVPVVSQ